MARDNEDRVRGTRRGGDFEGGDVADYTPENAVPITSQATIDYFNKTYGTRFKDPVQYYDWVFGGKGAIVPSADPKQDSSKYYRPESGDINKVVNQPLPYNPEDSMDFKLVKAGLLAAGGAGLSSGLAGVLPSFGNTAVGKIASGALNSAATGGIMSGVQGGDPISGAVKGAIGGTVGSGVNTGLKALGVTDPTLTGAASGASGALAVGGNPILGGAMGAAGGAASRLMAGDEFKGANVADTAMETTPQTTGASADAPWGVNPRNAFEGANDADLAMETAPTETAFEGANAFDLAMATSPAVDGWDLLGQQQAVDGSAESIYASNATAGMPGYDASLAFGAAPASSGFLDKTLGWAKENPLLAATGLGVAGGLIKGAFTPTPEDQAKALADAKVKSELEIQAARRANNNLSGISVARLKPSGSRLDRPGIINRALRMPQT